MTIITFYTSFFLILTCNMTGLTKSPISKDNSNDDIQKQQQELTMLLASTVYTYLVTSYKVEHEMDTSNESPTFVVQPITLEDSQSSQIVSHITDTLVLNSEDNVKVELDFKMFLHNNEQNNIDFGVNLGCQISDKCTDIIEFIQEQTKTGVSLDFPNLQNLKFTMIDLDIVEQDGYKYLAKLIEEVNFFSYVEQSESNMNYDDDEKLFNSSDEKDLNDDNEIGVDIIKRVPFEAVGIKNKFTENLKTYVDKKLNNNML